MDITTEDLDQLEPEDWLASLESQLNQLSFNQYSTPIKDLLLAKTFLSKGKTVNQTYDLQEIKNLPLSKLLKLAQSLRLGYWEFNVTTPEKRQKVETRIARILRLLNLLEDEPLPLSNLPTVQSTTHNPFVVPQLDPIVGPKIRYLSEGSYAEVYQSEFGYAVKHSFDSEMNKSTLNELRILRYVDHPNVINPVAVQLSPVKWALPLAQSDLTKVDLGSIEVRKLIFYQIFRALDYLHHRRIWHLDIKPQNILVFNVHGTTVVKLTDFGLSKLILHELGLWGEAVTLYWRAPEIQMNLKYDQSADIWAAGIMLLNASGPPLFTSGKPLSERSFIQRIFKLLGEPRKEDWPEFDFSLLDHPYPGEINWMDYHPEEAQVIQACLTWPGLRKEAEEILALPYFDQYRTQIETQLPTNPKEESHCLQYLLEHQIPIRGNNPSYNDNNRTKLINWIEEVRDRSYLSTSTFFSAVMLMDVINDRGKIPVKSLQKYMSACFWIASQYEDSFDPPVHRDDLVLLSANSFTLEEFDLAVQKALTRLRFELVIPTVWTFVDQWGIELDSNLDHLEGLEIVARKLIMNYNYVKTYTPSQLAQICFESLQLEVSCLSSEKLYHSGIDSYLEQG